MLAENWRYQLAGIIRQDYKKNVFMEADMRCSNAIHGMEKRLRATCHSSDDISNVVKVLDALLAEYEESSHGPGKWQKLKVFLQQRFATLHRTTVLLCDIHVSPAFVSVSVVLVSRLIN